jgi:hypothetical protein
MMDVSEWHENLQKKMNGSRLYIQPFSANIKGKRCHDAKRICTEKCLIVTESGQLVAVSARDIDMPRILCPVRPVLR